MSRWNDASELAGTSGCRAMPCAQELAAPLQSGTCIASVSDPGPLNPSEGLVAVCHPGGPAAFESNGDPDLRPAALACSIPGGQHHETPNRNTQEIETLWPGSKVISPSGDI